MSSSKTIMAIMYDFDKTLCTKDMQEYTFIPNIGMKSTAFWAESKSLAEDEKMDQILAYMYLMLKKSRNADKPILRKVFVDAGKNIEFYPGVLDWFDRINDYGKKRGITIEHYIISSGLKEIIEGTKLKKMFKEIYACEFLYDANGIAVWPKLAVNYTAKTQFLFRINKGVLDLSKNNELNQFIPDNERRVPFSRMIYIGDGLTDVPCMKLVKLNGGKSIAVFKERLKKIGNQLLQDGRVDFIAKADYSADSELEKTVKAIIDSIQTNHLLVAKHLAQVQALKKAKEKTKQGHAECEGE